MRSCKVLLLLCVCIFDVVKFVVYECMYSYVV